MVHSFATLKTTPEVIQKDLQMSPEEFDKDYMAWLDKRVGQTAANFNSWRQGLKELVALAKANQNDAVVKAAPEVLRLYPEYVGDANAYEFLAAAQLAKDDKQGAMTTLTGYEKMGGEAPETLTKLASLEEELGHAKEAAATLDRINYIYPEAEGLHRHLGELWLAQGNYPGAVREYTAVVALKPLDKPRRSSTWRRRTLRRVRRKRPRRVCCWRSRQRRVFGRHRSCCCRSNQQGAKARTQASRTKTEHFSVQQLRERDANQWRPLLN